MALPLEQLEGKYEILEKIREGGMGAIYKVRHVLLGEIRVVKVMRADLADREEAQERFSREARSAIRLRHPNIAQLHDFSLDDDGTGLIVMEYIDGLSFQDVLKSYGSPGVALALEMALQSLRALEYLHRLGYVHRDISPDNLMLTRDVDGEPLVKLIDLGIAKGRTSGDPGVTSTGTVLGKIRYSAPENFKSGSSSVCARADLYSFGIVLYELLTGAYPIRGRDLNTILAGHLVQPVLGFDDTDPGGAVHPELRAIVEQALEKDQAKRIPSAERFWSMLHELRKRHAPPPSPPGLLDEILSGTPTPSATTHPSPGTTQGLLDREFPPEDTGSSPRPAHLEVTGESAVEPPPWRTPPPDDGDDAGVPDPRSEPLRGSGLIERAWDLFDDGDLDESERLLREALAVSPGHPGERGLGQRIADAKEQRLNLEADARRQRSRQLIDQAADSFEAGDLERCEALLREAGQADPTDPLPAEEIARLREIADERERRARDRAAPVPPPHVRLETQPTLGVPVAASPPESAAAPGASSPAAPRSTTEGAAPRERAPAGPLITQPVAAQQQPDVTGDAGRATPPDSAVFDRLPEAYTSATPGSLSPWVWSLPAIAVLIAAGFLASRFLNRSAPPPPDSAVAAVSSAERPMPASAEPTVAAPGAEPSTRGRDELGAEDVDGGSSAARTAAAPERDAPAAAARSGSPISLTESFPILRTAKRDEAYDVLRRAQAAGFRAAISRNPRDPLPYTVEAGPHRTAEEAQLEARRARAALGLDQPAGRSRERPPASSETTERADPPPTTSASTAARPSREETATTPRPEQPQPGAQRTPATQEATAAPERAEQQAPREAGERGGASDQPIPVSGDVVAPRLIDGPPPLYTLMARRARLQGVVVMRAVIDEQGAVVDATVLKGLPMGLNESALNAVKGWRYQPATLGGAPVKVTYNIAVNFRLQ